MKRETAVVSTGGAVFSFARDRTAVEHHIEIEDVRLRFYTKPPAAVDVYLRERSEMWMDQVEFGCERSGRPSRPHGCSVPDDGPAGTEVDDADDLEHIVIAQLNGLSSALAAFKSLLGAQTEVARNQMGTILQRICEQIVTAVPSVGMASVTMIEDNMPITVACSDARAHAFDTEQHRTGQGPCLHAATSGQITTVSAEEIARRWPVFAGAVGESSRWSVLSAPLAVDGERSGSLNLYSDVIPGFGELDAAMVGVYVTAIDTAIWNARRVERALAEIGGLNDAMAHRAVIEQAKGILMVTFAITADEAFTKLAVLSQNRNIKLSVVAQLLTAGKFTVEDLRPRTLGPGSTNVR